MRDNYIYLNHILESINKIENFIKDAKSLEDFEKNTMMVSAVIREMEVIGEASKNIDSEFKNKNSDIPWREMADMRNVLIHGYFGVNLKIVWDTATFHLKELKKIIGGIIDNKI